MKKFKDLKVGDDIYFFDDGKIYVYKVSRIENNSYIDIYQKGTDPKFGIIIDYPSQDYYTEGMFYGYFVSDINYIINNPEKFMGL